MSTYWDVRCMTCDVGLGLHGNHQDEPAHAIATSAPVLAQVAALAPALVVVVSESFEFYDERTCYTVHIKWFSDHAGHDIQARNEYGETHAQCAARWASYKLVPK